MGFLVICETERMVPAFSSMSALVRMIPSMPAVSLKALA